MLSIIRANEDDFELLANLGKQSFIESHGHSAAAEDIAQYAEEKYAYDMLKKELSDPKNIYHIVYYNSLPAGYSKIVLSEPHPSFQETNITKLERLYLLKAFYDLKLGFELLKHNLAFSQSRGEAGIWLYVWKENHRAIRFYQKAAFLIVGDHDFKISETHYNPNYRMLLRY